MISLKSYCGVVGSTLDADLSPICRYNYFGPERSINMQADFYYAAVPLTVSVA